MKLLVERDNVVADLKDNSGWTPLLCAVWLRQEAVVKLLVKRDDVDANSKDNSSWTLLL